jgi:hypothetical protein
MFYWFYNFSHRFINSIVRLRFGSRRGRGLVGKWGSRSQGKAGQWSYGKGLVDQGEWGSGS